MASLISPVLSCQVGAVAAEESSGAVAGNPVSPVLGAGAAREIAASLGPEALVLAAALVGMLLGLLMAFLAVNLGLSQHVSGLGITLFATQ